MKGIFLLILLFCLIGLTVDGQHTDGSLEVARYQGTIPLPVLINQALAAPPDTNKVWKLIGLGSIYWRLGVDNHFDTCLLYARQAQSLSLSLHYTAGNSEAIFLQCKALTEMDDMPEAIALLSLVYGEERVRILLILAERYVNHKPIDRSYLEKALPYADMAQRLSDSLGSTHWRYETRMLLAKYWFEHNDFTKAKNSILQIIVECHAAGNLELEAHYWAEQDHYLPITTDLYSDHCTACYNAWHLYNEAGNRKDGLVALRDLAYFHLVYDKDDSAEIEFDSVLRLSEQLKVEPTVTTNLMVGYLYTKKGELDKALYYYFKGFHQIPPTDTRRQMVVYRYLAEIYMILGQTDEEMRYGKLAVELSVALHENSMYFLTFFVVDSYLRQGKPDSALDFCLRFNEQHPSVTATEKEIVYRNLGLIYDKKGDYSTAESWYLKMIGIDQEAENEFIVTIFHFDRFITYQADLDIGKFYLHWRQYKKARLFLEKAIINGSSMTAPERGETELMLFRADSALGDSKAALTHFMKHTVINDSMFNVARSKQLQEVETKFETEQNKNSIRLLQSEGKRQQSELKREGLLRNIIIGGMVLLFVIAVWIWRNYVVKRRNLLRLELQQEEINRQNLFLKKLVGEKDLLMGEVHHRVKNNLQIVISLLESQSARMHNDTAQAALLDGQNRIYAISLLHQKLYRTSAITEVDMAAYIPELADYLADSLDAGSRRISIVTDVSPLKLDIAQALPVGIILNESVTNAIKYAFPGDSYGRIEIDMHLTEDGPVRLEIRDNGIGLASGLDPEAESMGMTLIKGLSKQLHGQLMISGNRGVAITVEFDIASALEPQ